MPTNARRLITPERLTQLAPDLAAALTAILIRQPTIYAQRTNWAAGYPQTAPGGGHGSTPDPMAEQIASRLSPPNVNADGDLDADEDGDEQPPQPPRRTPDPAATATAWCAELTAVTRRLLALEVLAAQLVPIRAHPDCPQFTTGGLWCRTHQGDAVRDETRPEAAKLCRACGRTYEGRTVNGMDKPCADSWERAAKAGKAFDTWLTERRAMLGAALPRTG